MRQKKTKTRAYDGWLSEYRVNRKIEDHELLAKLDIKEYTSLRPRDKGLLKINSVFMEWIDQHYVSRGWAAMGGLPAFGILLYFALFFALASDAPLVSGRMPSQVMVIVAWSCACMFAIGCFGVLRVFLVKDFFCYTHYPIRFNRQDRKVYVFRHGGAGGVLELNWDDGYWFVGYNDGDRVFDIRCHVLDASGVIRHTFAIAGACDTKTEALQHWAMIRGYMEEPLCKLPFPPLRLYMATKPTWRNSFVMRVGTFGGISKYMLISVPWAFFRWISQKTCRSPRWPESVEAVCQIQPDDPYHMAEPRAAGEPIVCDPASVQAEQEYEKLLKAEVIALEGRAARSSL